MSASDELRKQIAAEDAAAARMNQSSLDRKKDFERRARHVEFSEPELRRVLDFYFIGAQCVIGGMVQLQIRLFRLKSKGYELLARKVFTEDLAYQVDAGPWNPVAAWTLEVKAAKSYKRNGLIWLLLGPNVDRPQWFELGADFGQEPANIRPALAKLSEATLAAGGSNALYEVREKDKVETTDRWLRYLLHP